MHKITEKSNTPSLIMLPYLLVVFAVVAGFTAVNAGVRTLTGYTAAPSNPFAAFADVFPDQPSSAAASRGFLCPSPGADDTYQDTSEETCSFRPESGPFFQVRVNISGDMIRHIDFRMRENTLRVGDLIGLWGSPEVDEYSRSAYLHWRSRGIFALATHDTGSFSLFLPVWTVNFSYLTSDV
jgi:hypothetical protein